MTIQHLPTTRRRLWPLPAMVAVLLAALACTCGGGGGPLGALFATATPTPTLTPTPTNTPLPTNTPVPTNTPPPTLTPRPTVEESNNTTTSGGGGGDVNLDVVNETNASICYVYVSEVGEDEWGDDALGTDSVIGPGDTLTISGPAGTYDLIFEDCDHNVIAWYFNGELTQDDSITIYGTSDVLIIANESSSAICWLYVADPSSDTWGRSFIHLDHPVPADGSRSFAVLAGTWDLRAVSCDGDEVTSYDSDLSGEMIWTLTDN